MVRLPRVLAAVLVAAAIAALAPPGAALAEQHTSSDLLLPYFEIDLDGQRTTLFAVGNGHAEPVTVRATLATNWGIPVLRVSLELAPGQVRTVNLRDWVADGSLPTQTLGAGVLAHVQAALTGGASPDDGLYYGSAVEPGLAVGSLTLRVESSPRTDSLWGDYFWIDAAGNSAEGGSLVDIDRGSSCIGLCDRHLMRFLQAAAFDGGTELIVWTGRSGGPSPTPEPDFVGIEVSGQVFYREDGARFDERALRFLPTQAIPLVDLALAEDFGWIDIVSAEPIYIGTRHRAEGRYAVSLESWCQKHAPVPGPPPLQALPGLDIEKLTNGMDADLPPGPMLEIGSPVTWQYVVTNTGNIAINGISVSDNRGVAVSCPRTTLAVGQTMTCTGSGVVEPGPYSNVGTVTGTPPDGPALTDSDPSHYNGVNVLPGGGPGIDVEKLTNGQQADQPPGPTLVAGDPVTWTYSVTNIGGYPLTDVTVVDSDPAVRVVCPATTLGIAETMICSAAGTVRAGAYSNTATASGSVGGAVFTDEDDSHYFGLPEAPPTAAPSIRIEKATNGFDADGVGSAPQLVHGDPVTWTYVVSNTGNVPLSGIQVTDDQGVAVSCPGTTLGVGDQMTCTGSGTAVASDHCYCNVGLAVGSPPEGDAVTDSDPSHYCARPVPGVAAIEIEKSTNGADADVAPGPTLTEGDNVQWAYVVTNTGDVTLTGITVVDDQGVTVTCDGGQPFSLSPGASKTCLGNGTAVLGQYANVGTATGSPEGGGSAVSDSDPSHYLGVTPGSDGGGEGDQGCTPGYWKNHADSWPPTGYGTGQAVEDVFAAAAAYPQGDATLLAALSFGGGSGVEGAVEILLRAAVAALLNASHPDVAYPRTTAEVLSSVDSALATGDRDTMLALAAELDADNNEGCPLD